jgi:hypothetical protein
MDNAVGLGKNYKNQGTKDDTKYKEKYKGRRRVCTKNKPSY